MLKQSPSTLCHSLSELIEADLKVGILKEEGIETFGWISSDYEMIRSPLGAVWIQLSRDMDGDEFTPPSLGEEDEGSITAPVILPEEEEEENGDVFQGTDKEDEDVFQDPDDYGPLWNQ